MKCPHCEQALTERSCPHCHAAIVDVGPYCSYCGRRLNAEAAGVAEPAARGEATAAAVTKRWPTLTGKTEFCAATAIVSASSARTAIARYVASRCRRNPQRRQRRIELIPNEAPYQVKIISDFCRRSQSPQFPGQVRKFAWSQLEDRSGVARNPLGRQRGAGGFWRGETSHPGNPRGPGPSLPQ